MSSVISRTFRSGNSEALRLPKDVAFGCDVEVTIVRSGDVLTISPNKGKLADLIRVLDELPRPSSVETPDLEFPPERPGL